MSRTDPQIKLRLPEMLKARIEAQANKKKRSMNAEILSTLENAYLNLYDPYFFTSLLKQIIERSDLRAEDLRTLKAKLDENSQEDANKKLVRERIARGLSTLEKINNQIAAVNRTVATLDNQMKAIQRIAQTEQYERINLPISVRHIADILAEFTEEEIEDFDREFLKNSLDNPELEFTEELMKYERKISKKTPKK